MKYLVAFVLRVCASIILVYCVAFWAIIHAVLWIWGFKPIKLKMRRIT